MKLLDSRVVRFSFLISCHFEVYQHQRPLTTVGLLLTRQQVGGLISLFTNKTPLLDYVSLIKIQQTKTKTLIFILGFNRF